MALIRAFARASPGGEAIGPNSGTRGSREASSLDDQTRVRRFESFFVPHLDAAYNFARWLTLIGLIFAIAIGVVFYFAITGFK